MTAFRDRVGVLLAEYFRLWPLRATEIGAHEHDGRWPDFTDAGRSDRLAFLARWERELVAMDPSTLDRDERIDRDLVLAELAAHRFDETELREESWDALSWVYLLGGGIFPLLAREFAPLGDRLASVTSRLEALPAVVDAAVASLTGLPDRPVSRLHVETALTQLPGILELVGDAVRTADEAAPTDAAVAAMKPRLDDAAEVARDALERLRGHLETTLLPAAVGEGRLGAELFARKLRHTLKIELTPDALLEQAEREYVAVRAEMLRLAAALWPTWLPDQPLPTAASAGSDAAAERETVAAVLDVIAREHPSADGLLDFCRAELARVEDFVRERDVVALADEPLEIRWTPVFMRSFGGALLDPPGPLDRGQKSFFCVTPVPDDWSVDQVESHLREVNDRMLRLLTIHEAVPGHYLQLARANGCPSITRAVFWSGVFAEGWAVYVTQVMIDLGYAADDPALLLSHWKYYLRAVVNSIIDVRIHGRDMTEDEAIRLMVDGAFQEQAEARQKWDRARLTSTQLSTYFVGSLELWGLERDVRRRLAAASGDPRGAAAVPEPRVVGGFGDTPGFDYQSHLETVLAHGTPPTPLLRRMVLGDEADAVAGTAPTGGGTAGAPL